MHRRDVLARLAIGGAGAVLGRSGLAAPLRRINVALLDEAPSAATGDCGVDHCSTRDACLSGDAGHVCHQRDVCVVDESGDCTRDECTQADASNKGATCTDDWCASDSSLECSGDSCTTDSSGGCTGDACTSDKSGGCAAHDQCVSDKSGACGTFDLCESDSSSSCATDDCAADSSGACTSSDNCSSDSSGECAADECTGDSSGACTPSDTCASDASGACVTDSCVSDASSSCVGDGCEADSSGACNTDQCVSDKSGFCAEDRCASDKSAECTSLDDCLSDSSKSCGDDGCRSDSSAACAGDRCASDSSKECTQADVCVADSSQTCVSDLCRRDADVAPCTTDSCAPDLQAVSTRRTFTRLGRALRWLYEIGAAIALCLLAAPPAAAQTAINTGCNATFYPRAVTLTATPVSPGAPKGAFLADYDGDGILEADTDGNGFDAADPEVADRDGDGTRDLPPGTAFAGTRRYTVFWVPDDAVISASGFLKVIIATDARVFGAIRLAAGIEIAARGVIDVRSSAWLSETGEVKLTSALAGAVVSSTCSGLEEGVADPPGGVIDTDLDGALDAAEGTADGDADGVPDWQDQDTASLPSPAGTGAIVADMAEGVEQRLDFTAASIKPAADPTLPPARRPASGIFLFGVQDLTVAGMSPGETVTLTLHLPIPAPPSSQYWRVDATGWHLAALGSNDGDATVTVALTDGGPDDRDGAVNGAVREVGAVVLFARQPSTPVRRRFGSGAP